MGRLPPPPADGARPPPGPGPGRQHHPYDRAYWQPHPSFYPTTSPDGPRWVGPPAELPASLSQAPPVARGAWASAARGCVAVLAGTIFLFVAALVGIVVVVDSGWELPFELPFELPEARREKPSAGQPRRSDVAPLPAVVPAPIGEVGAREVRMALHAGSCSGETEERDQPTYYLGWRGKGSAARLRGRVALVHLQLQGRGAKWTATASRGVTLSAAVSRAFFLEQAARWSITDLTIDAIVWPVTTPLAIPQPRVDAKGRIDRQSAMELEAATRLAVETAAGRRLEQVALELTQRGYQEVAFLVHLPAGPLQVRDFSLAAYTPGEEAEFAFLVAPRWGAPERGFVASHELLHLFGADDLYRKVAVAAEERNEVMNAYCRGLGSTSIEGATAYAIGWREAVPARPYGFAR